MSEMQCQVYKVKHVVSGHPHYDLILKRLHFICYISNLDNNMTAHHILSIVLLADQIKVGGFIVNYLSSIINNS